MRARRRLALICLVLLCLASPAPAPAAGPAGGWVCPPCGHADDDRVFDAPGSCPACGMKLVPRKSVKERPDVAIVVFDGVQIIDFTGPYEVFGQQPFNVFTVSKTGETITTTMGMSVNPTHSFESSPEPDVLIVPGGHVHDVYEDEGFMSWVKEAAAGADHVLSVCNGAFILAQAGLLDGKSATTFYGLIDELKRFRPAVNVVDDQRFVDNGVIVTSAGLSSGIDASLHVVGKMRGELAAKRLALHLEYDWRPASGFARAALADRRLPELDMGDDRMTLLASDGDRDGWEVRYRVETSRSLEQLMEHVGGELAANPTWERTASRTDAGAMESRWRFRDGDDEPWIGEVRIEPEADRFVSTLRIRRAGARGASGR